MGVYLDKVMETNEYIRQKLKVNDIIDKVSSMKWDFTIHAVGRQDGRTQK